MFDSLTSMALGVPSERRFKELVYALAKHMRDCGVTFLATMEAAQLGGDQTIGGGVSFMADNVIRLRYFEQGGRLERALSVLKARGTAHGTETRQFRIARGGLRIGRTVSGRRPIARRGADRRRS